MAVNLSNQLEQIYQSLLDSGKVPSNMSNNYFKNVVLKEALGSVDEKTGIVQWGNSWGTNIFDYLKKTNQLFNYKKDDIDLAKKALIKSGNPNPSEQDAINYISSTGDNFKNEANKLIGMQTTDRGDGVQVSTETLKKQEQQPISEKIQTVSTPQTQIIPTIGDLQNWAKQNNIPWNEEAYSKAYAALTGDVSQTQTQINNGMKKGIYVLNQTPEYSLRAYNNETGQWVYVKPGEYVKGVSLQPNPNYKPDTTTNETSGVTSEGTASGATADTTTNGVDYSGINKMILDAVKNGQITQSDADLASMLIKKYDSPTISYDNIIKEFKNIADTSISPEFRERANKYIGDIQFLKTRYEGERARELEAERFTSGENIRQAQEGLEDAGMTFSGKAIKTLGNKSAYIKPEATMGGQLTTTVTGETVEYDPATGKILQTFSTSGQIPTQSGIKDEAGTTRFYEGTVNQSNRLMSSGSQARYEAQMQALGRGTEDYLGSDRAKIFGLDYQPIGNVTGSLEKEEQQARAGALSNLFQNYGVNEQRTSTQLTS